MCGSRKYAPQGCFLKFYVESIPNMIMLNIRDKLMNQFLSFGWGEFPMEHWWRFMFCGTGCMKVCSKVKVVVMYVDCKRTRVQSNNVDHLHLFMSVCSLPIIGSLIAKVFEWNIGWKYFLQKHGKLCFIIAGVKLPNKCLHFTLCTHTYPPEMMKINLLDTVSH